MKMPSRAALFALLALWLCVPPALAQDTATLPKAFGYTPTGNEILPIGVPSAVGSGYSYQAIRVSQLGSVGGGSLSASAISGLPTAAPLSATDAVPCVQGVTLAQCSPTQQRDFTLGAGILALPAATALTGTEMSNAIQGSVPVKTTVAQIGAYTLGAGMTPARLSGALRARPSILSRWRYLGDAKSQTAAYTFFQTMRAPAAFDAIQIIGISTTVDSTNPVKFSVSAPDSYGDGVNPKVAGSAIAPTPVTWGTTACRNPRNPGGGQPSFYQSGASGSGIAGGGTLIEGTICSDIIQLPSVARTDVPGAPPLLMIREYGAAAPTTNSDSIAVVGATNGVNTALPDFFCGYVGATDLTATNGVTAPDTGHQGVCPLFEVIYYLRGTPIYTIATAGDSIQQGFCGGAAVNCSAGRVNGWTRQLATMMTAAGNTTGFAGWNYQGEPSLVFNERALNAFLSDDCAPGVTHLFFTPFSGNEGYGTTAILPADFKRSEALIDRAQRCGIVPVLVYPWAGQSIGSAATNAVVAWIDGAKAAGVATFDGRSIMSADGSTTSNIMNPDCVTKDSSGNAVDQVHPNAVCQARLAAAAYAQRGAWALP